MRLLLTMVQDAWRRWSPKTGATHAAQAAAPPHLHAGHAAVRKAGECKRRSNTCSSSSRAPHLHAGHAACLRDVGGAVEAGGHHAVPVRVHRRAILRVCVCVCVCACVCACVCLGAGGHHAAAVRVHKHAILWEQSARWRAWGQAQGHALAWGCVHRGTVKQAGMRIGHTECTEAGLLSAPVPYSEHACEIEATMPASHLARDQASGDAATMHATCHGSM